MQVRKINEFLSSFISKSEAHGKHITLCDPCNLEHFTDVFYLEQMRESSPSGLTRQPVTDQRGQRDSQRGSESEASMTRIEAGARFCLGSLVLDELYIAVGKTTEAKEIIAP